MPITIKCPECGHAEQSEDGEAQTCPMCEGTMAAPQKKKYQAKNTSLEDEARLKKKSKARDDEDDRPRKKAKPRDDEDEDNPKPTKQAKAAATSESPFSLDDDDEGEKGESSTRDGKAAEALDLNPGFKNRALMKQVEAELSRGEVLHWAGRMCPEIAKTGGTIARIFGFVFAGAGLLFCVLVLVLAPGMAKIAVIVPLLFVGIGVAVAVLLPGAMAKQAARAWYAVTNERAIVYTASLWGNSGEATTYEPRELRRMRVKSASSPRGAGDLIFKTTTATVVTSAGSGRTRTEERPVHHGFLGIENVREVETLIHKVLLSEDDDDDDDDDE